jgi:hypothetical protein
MDDMKTFIRTEGLRYLNARNINSIGIGRKISAKGPSLTFAVRTAKQS